MQGSATPKTLLSWEGLEVGCWQLMSLDFGSCGTTIHLCHLVLFDSQNQNKQLFVFKRMAYLVDQIDSVGVSHKTISIATKTFEQINAEYLALQIL